MTANRIWQVLSGLPEGERRRRWLLMLQAYVDDSGRLNKSSVCVLGGYIAQAERWAEFSDKWQAVLDDEPRIKYFKMSEWASRLDEFDGFTDGERDYKLRQLAKLIPQYAQAGIVAVVPSDAFKRTLAGLIDREYHRRPYALLALGIMAQFATFVGEKHIQDQWSSFLMSRATSPKQWGTSSLSSTNSWRPAPLTYAP